MVHKSHGITLTYMQEDLNWFAGKKIATGENCQQPISQCQFYILLSCAKSRDKVLLLNFEPEDIKVNESVLEEMVQVGNESLFSWQHPLIEVNDISMCLFNIRSSNCNLEHFLNDKIFSTYSSYFCFTGLNVNVSPAKHIDDVLMIGKTSIRIHNIAWACVTL